MRSHIGSVCDCGAAVQRVQLGLPCIGAKIKTKIALKLRRLDTSIKHNRQQYEREQQFGAHLHNPKCIITRLSCDLQRQAHHSIRRDSMLIDGGSDVPRGSQPRFEVSWQPKHGGSNNFLHAQLSCFYQRKHNITGQIKLIYRMLFRIRGKWLIMYGQLVL